MKEIPVLKNSVQSAKLVGYFMVNPPEDRLIFKHIQLGEHSGEWGFNSRQVRLILLGQDVRVNEYSKKYQNMGTFDIGYCTNWLYNHSIHPDPKAFRTDIINLLTYSIYGSVI